MATWEMTASSMAEFLAKVDDTIKSFAGAYPVWRGHGDATWKLTASICHHGDTERPEHSMALKFKELAQSRYDKCPPWDDDAAWLFLMRHYGLWVRLLDWTQSPLFALFFAVQDEKLDKNPGCVWALEPVRFNEEQNFTDIPVKENPEVLQLYRDAFVRPEDKRSRKILKIESAETDPRHLVQQSVYTIHGTGTPIEELPNYHKFLRKIEVPALSKPEFYKALLQLGINRSTLFPDLDNLSAHIHTIIWLTE